MSTKPKTNENEELSLLEKNYNIAKDSLDASKQRSQQNANVTLEKLKKYLPEYVKSQGMGGTGMSETSLLQAYNDYSRNMSDIESSYQQQHNELLSNYNTAKLAEEKEEQYALYEVEMTNLKNLYDSLKGTDGKITDADYTTLSNYVNKIKDSIGDDNHALAEAVLKGYEQNKITEEKRAENEANKKLNTAVEQAKIVQGIKMTDLKFKDDGTVEDAKYLNGGYGDDFTFEYNGNEVDVEKGYKVSSEIEKILSKKVEKPIEGSAIVYNGVLYMYLPNNHEGGEKGSSWWSVNARGDSLNGIFDTYK